MKKDLKKIDTNFTANYSNNEFSNYPFQLQILFYLVVQKYHETFHTLNDSESEVKFLSIK